MNILEMPVGKKWVVRKKDKSYYIRNYIHDCFGLTVELHRAQRMSENEAKLIEINDCFNIFEAVNIMTIPYGG